MGSVKDFLQKSISQNEIFGAWLLVGQENKIFDLILSLIPKDIFQDNDVLTLAEESELDIDAVRQIKTFLALRPIGVKKFVAIKEAHKLNLASQNAFLKILEEPPEYACIFLITAKPESLLPTILSRARQLKFEPGDSFETSRDFYQLTERFLKSDFAVKSKILEEIKAKKDWQEFYKALLLALRQKLILGSFESKEEKRALIKLLKKIVYLEGILYELNLNNRLQLEAVFL